MHERAARRWNTRAVTAACVALVAMATAVPAATATPRRVRLIGEAILQHALRFEGTTVGGLSGIDYDPATGRWVLISDDRSQHQPARFYEADIDLSADDVDVRLTGTSALRRPNGGTHAPNSVDPESIRFDPRSGDLWWSSEGLRPGGSDSGAHRIDPSIGRVHRAGDHAGRVAVAPNLRMSAHAGARQNLALEGLALAAGGTRVVSAMEGPLLQDGPEPTTERGALTRISVQARNGRVLSQHAYPVDPVFADSPGGGFATNGVTSILPTGEPGRYLVMERSFVSGVGNSIRIYAVSTRQATDVSGTRSLRGADVTTARKELLVDLSRFEGLSTVDNVEGMTWGPRLPSGKRTLVLVSDDNFSSSQTTQVIALAV